MTSVTISESTPCARRPVSNPSSASFHKLVLKEVPESIGKMIAHNVAAIAELTERIKALDTSISRVAAERYPE